MLAKGKSLSKDKDQMEIIESINIRQTEKIKVA